MTPEQIVKELAARLDDSVALTGNWRNQAPVPVAEFVTSCLIVEKEGETEGGLIPFRLWDAQREALEVIEQEPFLTLPKGRQVGITWLELAAMGHAARSGGNRLFNIARPSGAEARDAIRRLLILYGYDANSDPPNMQVLPESPPEMARWRPAIVSKTLTSLTLENGSHFQAKTATRHIARGDAAYWTLCDEYAFWMWPKEQLNALEHGAHRVHVVSSGNGGEDAFSNLCKVALAGHGKWRLHFVSATADPRRDDEWFRRNIDEAANPDLAKRELARKLEDVFLSASGNYFKRFSHERNVREFSIVPNWEVTNGVDFGFVHPVCLWFQVSPSGQPFIFGEYLPTEIPSPEFAQGCIEYERDLLAAEGVELAAERGPMYCDPAGKARNMQTSRSEFDVMQAAGFRPHGETSGFRDGCDLLTNAIAPPEIPLIIHPRCVKTIQALLQIPPDKLQPDVYLQKHPVYSHPVDAARYWIVNNRRPRGTFELPRPQRSSPLSRTF